MSDAPKDEDAERVQRAVESLGEYFDTVQIFVTRHESGKEGGTVHLQRGGGNWFARFGQVREWLVKMDEEARTSTRKDNDL